ncbi:hypothetical protein Scep_007441 [Stephania cephalantha]|uniref:Uncharacterized protein n=1 Tax=Stephania cephalantha TaxID=152367 RepID=A0AAP0KBU5_9MAGN
MLRRNWIDLVNKTFQLNFKIKMDANGLEKKHACANLQKQRRHSKLLKLPGN